MFDIKIIDGYKYKDGQSRAQITINNFMEDSPLITDFWDENSYKKQWKIALQCLYAKQVKTCALITDIRPRNISCGLMYWVLYAIEDTIYIQEKMHAEALGLPYIPQENVMSPRLIENLIPARETSSTTDDFTMPISEWKIDFEDIKHLTTL